MRADVHKRATPNTHNNRYYKKTPLNLYGYTLHLVRVRDTYHEQTTNTLNLYVEPTHLVRVRNEVGDVHVPALARRVDAHALVDERELDDQEARLVEVVGRVGRVKERAARVARERDVWDLVF